MSRCLGLLKRGLPKEAEAVCRKALLGNRLDPDLNVVLSRILLERRDFSGAYEVLLPLASLDRQQSYVYYNFGLALKGLNRLAESVVFVRRAVEMDPSSWFLRSKLGQLQLMLGEPDLARETLRTALSQNAKDSATLINLAQASIDLNDFASAEAYLDEAKLGGRHDAIAYRLRGSLHELNGRFELARHEFLESLKIDPHMVESRVGIAYCGKVESDQDPNFQELLRLKQTIPHEDLRFGLVHYALGKGYEELSEFQQAANHFDVANRVFLEFEAQKGSVFQESSYRERCAKLVDECLRLSPYITPSADDRPIFIVGMIRSGTTLVEQMLGRHPDIAPGGEHLFWPFQSRVLLQGIADEHDFLSCATEGYSKVLDGVSMSAKRITDKMPVNYHVLGLLAMLYPKATFVHCKRGALDTALSIYTTKYRGSPDFGHDRKNIVCGYLTYLEIMEQWRQRVPSLRLVEVVYEDLVQSPREAMERILENAGLDFDERCIEPEKSSQAVKTPSSWGVRQPIYTTSVNRAERFPGWLPDFEPLRGL